MISSIAQLLLLLVGTLGLVSNAVAQQFPYTAYVQDDSIYVRSGPGQRYYPTSQLPQGFAVEVYRHDANGWCAIRPPEGSFSWIGSHQVRQVDTGVGEIVEDNVVTRVGSMLSNSRTAVQVLLPMGERLELLSSDEEEDPRWVRVAAPAGEFRWVAASALAVEPPIETMPIPLPNADKWASQSQSRQLSEPAGAPTFDHLNDSHNSHETGLQFGPPVKTVVDVAPVVQQAVADSSAMEVVAGSPADLQLAQFQAQPTPPQFLSEAPPTVSPTVQTPAPATSVSRPRVRFQGRTTVAPTNISTVEELELRLSQTVSQPPSEWKLDTLNSAANQLLTSTSTLPVRAQLREVIARIDRFQELKQRYENPPPMIIPERDPFEQAQNQTVESSETPKDLTGLSSTVRELIKEDLSANVARSQVSRSPATVSVPTNVTKPLFDAAGMLKPVVSQRPKAPKFALVDDQGKVVSFVTPTPELDLNQYVGRRVGVHGNRGYMPEYRRAHVTAGRVTPLTETVRR